ncbi:hypothetical protein Adt_27795 [Abeliophyllum distichum]|uniref:Uncharacterized protein n=1 Tax=Abeliophyllum distichum TaxID=126358 RepID=A0ABD1RUT0_9LAMI
MGSCKKSLHLQIRANTAEGTTESEDEIREHESCQVRYPSVGTPKQILELVYRRLPLFSMGAEDGVDFFGGDGDGLVSILQLGKAVRVFNLGSSRFPHFGIFIENSQNKKKVIFSFMLYI